jgi:hypothetical protein
MREQIGRVPDHQISVIIGGRVQLFALPMAAVVERDDAASGLSESLDPTRIHPIDAMIRGEAMNEQNWLAKVAAVRRNIDERDLDAVRRKALEHPNCPRSVRPPWAAPMLPPAISLPPGVEND